LAGERRRKRGGGVVRRSMREMARRGASSDKRRVCRASSSSCVSVDISVGQPAARRCRGRQASHLYNRIINIADNADIIENRAYQRSLSIIEARCGEIKRHNPNK